MSQIDWKKPIEYRGYGEKEWVPARLICTDRKTGDGRSHVILIDRGCDNESWMSFRADGTYAVGNDGYQLRNVPQNTCHIVITYRTKAGKLTASVQEGSLKNPSGKKYSVGEEFNNCKILHIAEFEIAA